MISERIEPTALDVVPVNNSVPLMFPPFGFAKVPAAN